ncbi:MAG TPA: aspartate--ammonia ligase [Salinimicrobium sp.]|nr:aspartate--ammonia ligase [Salinimicrobium sp.]
MKTITEKPDVFTLKMQTEAAIALVKSTFENELSSALNLKKISSPLIVLQGTGINDDLNGTERAVKFPVKDMLEQTAEVVQSLAKWKRLRLKDYKIPSGTGILTNMQALRPDENFSCLHSISVDQWDWEKVMEPQQRNLLFLKETVGKIYEAIKSTEAVIAENFMHLGAILPEKITFMQSEELLQKYPDHSPKERENLAAKEFGAIFIIGIGGKLTNNEIHDSRAPDYDDWTTASDADYKGLNGDLILWNPVLDQAMEISSMGIRVNAETLEKQLEISGCQERKKLFYHDKLLKGELPQSIGGGIGQSRLCMFLLKKKHIGEVQVSIWPDELRNDCERNGIHLL